MKGAYTLILKVVRHFVHAASDQAVPLGYYAGSAIYM